MPKTKTPSLTLVAPLETKEAAPVETKEALATLQETVSMDDAAFALKLDTVNKTAAQVQDDYQTLALAALLHCAKEKCADRINTLIRGIPVSNRRNAMRLYVETFGTVQYDKVGKQFSYDKTAKLQLWAANQKKWYNMNKEGDYQGLIAIEEMEKLYNRLVKKLESHKAEDKIAPELVNRFGAMIAEFKQAA